MAENPIQADTPVARGEVARSARPSPEYQEMLDRLRARKDAQQDAGAGSGPWFDDGMNHREGGAVKQLTEGSCVSAAGEMLSDGRFTQEELHSRLGDWSNPMALRDELNDRDGGGWQGHYFGPPDDAVRKASEGRMAAAVQAPHGPGHMVMLEPRRDGNFTVRDPDEGSSYDVGSRWVETYVSAGVWRG